MVNILLISYLIAYNCTTVMCTTMLLETIEYYVNNISAVFVLCIDAGKAFDRVCHSKLFKARCTPEKLTILTKHSKTFFFNHVVKNIVNYQLEKLYLKWTSIKGSNYAFATWCHSALKYL